MFETIRRALKSKLALVILAIILIAFVVTGISSPGTGGGALGGGEAVVRIGHEKITAADLSRRVQQNLAQARQQNPALDMAAFVAGGGFEAALSQLIATRSLEVWGKRHGFGASTKAIDGEIASIPAFAGLDGKFDQATFEQVLAQQSLNAQQIRTDIGGELIRRQMLIPIMGGARGSAGLVTPYAAQLLERRIGAIGVVPSTAVPPGPAPTEAEVAEQYRRNIARYTLPERRVIRYAAFGRTPVAPSEAEIAAAYRTNAATYAARETRSLSQVVLPDQAAATALAAKVAAGTPFAAAAQAAGFTPADTAIGDLTRPQLAERASAAVADAVFALPQGGTSAAVRSSLGWHVVRVDAVNTIAERPLAAVRDEIAAQLSATKSDEALANRVAAIEEAISDGSSFDDVVRTQKLAVVTTPPITATGASTTPGFTPSPELQPLLAPAFEAAADDDPVVDTITRNERYALTDVAQVIESAPQPLAESRARVTADIMAQRAAQAARTLAQGILAKAKAGTPLAAAFSSAGVPLEAPQRANAQQGDLGRFRGNVPPPLALLFAMAQGDTKLLALPDNAGWYVVQLASIEAGDPRTQPGLIASTTAEFGNILAAEYGEQFARAAGAEIGVTRDDAALASLKAQLGGPGAAQQ